MYFVHVYIFLKKDTKKKKLKKKFSRFPNLSQKKEKIFPKKKEKKKEKKEKVFRLGALSP